MSERVTVRLGESAAAWLDERFDNRSHGVRECISIARAQVDDPAESTRAEPSDAGLAQAYDALTAAAIEGVLPIEAAVATAASATGLPSAVVRESVLPALEARGFARVRQGMATVSVRIKPRTADPKEWSA